MELKDKRIDPSEVKQWFEEVKIDLHCCRYWKFSHWNFRDLSAPFWRFYYNEVNGAVVNYNRHDILLEQGNCMLIPPNTPFSISTVYEKSNAPENIAGSRIELEEKLEDFANHKMFDHFFIHFNLGLKFDGYKAGLYTMLMDEPFRTNIDLVKKHLRTDYEKVPFSIMIPLFQIIFHAIATLPSENWERFNYDKRVISTLNFIDQNLHLNLSNVMLAERISLATNSFARLFRESMGVSLQQYILKRRLEKSQHMLHHTQAKMERIASECGFYDLHHFSRIFKANMQVSPSAYKKRTTMS